MEDLKNLKSEIFELIREQDKLRLKFNELEQIKQQKLKELEAQEKAMKKDT